MCSLLQEFSPDHFMRVLELVQQAAVTGGVIVYCHKRATCDDVASRLREHINPTTVGVYHSSVSDAARSDVIHKWLTKQLVIVVATVMVQMAHGLGQIEYAGELWNGDRQERCIVQTCRQRCKVNTVLGSGCGSL